MIVKDVVRELDLMIAAGENGLDRVVTCGYTGDLLSCVMAHASQSAAWVTVQGHPNVIAVASLVGLAAVIVTEGARIDPTALEKANQEGIPVLTSQKSSFEVVSGLAHLGVKGNPC